MRGPWGTALVFAVNGAVQASWMSRLPAIRDRLHSGVVGLGLALLALGVGTLVGMPLTGTLCRRFGRRRVLFASSLVSCGMLVGIGATDKPVWLGLVLLPYGMATGAWDAAMNIQGAAVEKAVGRHWLTRLHGCWSAGSGIGAAAGVLAARSGLRVTWHLAVVALAGALAVALGARSFTGKEPARERHRYSLRHLTRLLRWVWLLTLLGATVEGAAGDWLAVYLTDARHASHGAAATAYALFVGGTAVGRFVADRLTEAIGPVWVVRLGAALAAAGVTTAVEGTPLAVPGAGALCWGLGACVVIPATISASGRAVASDEGITTTTTVGYSAGLIGPPSIGTLGRVIGLGPALLLLPFLAVGLIGLAGAVSPTGHRSG